jgi:hypothetical protein
MHLIDLIEDLGVGEPNDRSKNDREGDKRNKQGQTFVAILKRFYEIACVASRDDLI